MYGAKVILGNDYPYYYDANSTEPISELGKVIVKCIECRNILIDNRMEFIKLAEKHTFKKKVDEYMRIYNKLLDL